MPAGLPPLLSLRAATFRLGDRLVFEHTSWEIRRRENWAILGRNGSGKSLLGDAIRGRLPLVGGELTYHFGGLKRAGLGDFQKGAGGTPALRSPEELIGHVSFDERKREVHETVLQSRWNSIEEDTTLTVREFLSHSRVMEINPFEVRRGDAPERAAFEKRKAHASHLLQIEPFRDRTLLSLSNGERQRVEIARALCRCLRLFILDEPYTGLDRNSRRDLGQILTRLMQTALQVVLITTRAQDLPRGITHVAEVSDCKLTRTGRYPSRGRAQLGPGIAPAGAGSGATPVRRARASTPASKRPPGCAPLIALRGVTIKYGGRTILKGLDWTVREGESWALVGRNGSGKSTLLGLITGDNPQVFSQDVRVFGRDFGCGNSVWEIKKRVGYVSPELQVHFDESWTCLAVVASGFTGTVGLFECPAPSQLRAARRCLEEFGLANDAQTPLCALSTGMRRMALLARAMVSRPRLLLLDEPCQGLDGAHRRLVIGKVDTLIRAGEATVVFVTHRTEEIPPSIHRVLRLKAPRER